MISVPLLDRAGLAAGVEGTDPDGFDARVGLLAFRGAFTVASSRKLVWMVGPDIRDHDVAIFDFSPMTHVDDSAAHVMTQLMDRAVKEKTEVIVMGMSEDTRVVLDAFDVLKHVSGDRIVDDLDEARALAGACGSRTPAAVEGLDAAEVLPARRIFFSLASVVLLYPAHRWVTPPLLAPTLRGVRGGAPPAGRGSGRAGAG